MAIPIPTFEGALILKFSSLSAGSTLLFCLFSPLLQDKLGYSQLQVNLISLASEVGTHIPVPFLMFLSQYTEGYGGPGTVSVLPSISFIFGYFLAAYVFINRLHFTLMVLAFFFVGTGFVALQISGLTTIVGNMRSVQNALGLAEFLFGMSTVWQVQFAAKVFRRDEDQQLTTESLLLALGIFLGTVSMLGGSGLLSLPEWRSTKGVGDDEEAEEGPLDTEAADVIQSDAVNSSHQRQASYGSTSSNDISPSTRVFLNDRSAWLFSLAIFLSTGPAHTFTNNVSVHPLFRENSRYIYFPTVSIYFFTVRNAIANNLTH
ncbi:hypothetical protein DFP73DRAFT_481725 [Morchella snyderi]|nr:hypothetical protein DFP73DRAFT_481725 [Morchella snyderi]